MTDLQETNLWEWCKTHGDYAGYLMRYPNGSFAAEARTLMNDDNPSLQPTDISRGVEKEDYENCKLLSEFYAFIKKYPNGDFHDRAQNVIRTKQITTKCGLGPITGKEEECDFKACQVASEYKKFLEKYPSGIYKEQARVKYEQLINRDEAWRKDRKDEDELKECETIEDYRNYVETHQGKWAKYAEDYIRALQSEPKQILLQIVCCIIGIISVVVGLSLNRIIIAGAVLLGLGLIELFVHFVMPFDRRTLTKGDNYLQFCGYLMSVGGLVFMLI